MQIAINALFFNGDTMHKIYREEGKFNFIYQIPIIIYSSLISEPINSIVRYLALTENIIIEIKNAKRFINFKEKVNNISKKSNSDLLYFL